MHFKLNLSIYTLSICILLLVSCGEDEKNKFISDEFNATEELYQSINIPAYKGAFNVQRSIDLPAFKKVLNYHIDLPYPPNEIATFYDIFFSELKMKVHFYDSSERLWIFDPLDKKVPRLYSSNWIDNNENIMAHLSLEYKNKYKNNKHIGYFLEVTSYVRPFVTCNECIEFNKMLKKTGKIKKFEKLTFKYYKNGVLDVDKASAMNPNSDLLNEWIEIRKRHRRKLEEKYRAYAGK